MEGIKTTNMAHKVLSRDAVLAARSSCSSAEFEDLVQRNMAANAGLNFSGKHLALSASCDTICTIPRRIWGNA